MLEPTASRSSAAPPGRSLAPGAALLATAPRLSRRRAVLLVLGFVALWLVAQVLFGLPLLVLGAVLSGLAPLALLEHAGAAITVTSPPGALFVVGWALGALAVVALCRRWGVLSLAAMGLRREGTWTREIVLGLALGPLVFGFVLLSELALGWAEVRRGSVDAGGLLLGTVGYTGVAVNEEVVTRGVLLQVVARAWNPLVGLIASSAIFSLLHALNPNVTPLALVGLIVAGLMLGGTYLATGRLWLPIALHWSWNFAQGPLFGFPVSGQSGDSVLAVAPVGPEWATGGAFGPEAGLLGLAAEAVVLALVLGWRRAGASRAATTAVGLGGLAALIPLVLLGR